MSMSENPVNHSLETYRDGIKSAEARYSELWRYL